MTFDDGWWRLENPQTCSGHKSDQSPWWVNNLNAPSFGTSRLYFARRRGRLELRLGVAALISFDISHFKSCLVSVLVFIAFHDVFMFFFCGEMRHIERHDNHEIQQPAKELDLLRCLGHDVTLMSGSSSKTSFFVVPLWHVSFPSSC